jgi:hypothetical protein
MVTTGAAAESADGCPPGVPGRDECDGCMMSAP